MKGLDQNSATSNQRTLKEKTYVTSNHHYHNGVIADDNGSIGNGGGEPSAMHDVPKQWRVSSDRSNRGHVSRDIYDMGADDDRFGRRSAEDQAAPNQGAPSKVNSNRGWYSESRKSGDKHLPREGRKRKYLDDRGLYDDHQQSEDQYSDDDELEHSGSEISDASRSYGPQQANTDNIRSETWSWKPRYHDTRHPDDRLRKGAAKRRSHHRASYDRDVPSYSPLIREMGRYYQMQSPVPLEVRFGETLGQLLHSQELVLMKLDTIVNLLHKTVKALTSPQNNTQNYTQNNTQKGLSNEKESGSFQEHEVRSSTRQYREQLSDTEIQADYARSRENSKAPYIRYSNSTERERKSMVSKENRGKKFDGSQDIGVDALPEMIRAANNGGGRVELNDQLPPRIESYYSVRRKSPGDFHREQFLREDRGEDRGEDREEEGDWLRRTIPANVDGKSSGFTQATRKRTFSDYGLSTADVGKDTSVEKPSSVNGNMASEKVPLKESTNGLETSKSERRNLGNESDKKSHLASTEYSKDNAKTSDDAQRSLKINERPSMVDLSQTSNIILPHKYYVSTSEAFPSSGGGVEAVDTRDMPMYKEEGTASCAFTKQEWQGVDPMDKFSPPFSYRRRDSSEYRTWLARTFTTGSGHSEDFPRSMVTKGHEARSANHNGAKSSLTDNKKMMSSIAHLVMSSIDVSSEIVQILVATPSDNNISSKDQSRKSMEWLLNQSLAAMGCLPLISEIDLSVVQKIYQSSKNCMSFIYRLMDHCYAREELMRCRVAGGVRRYRGNNTETEQLCPKRLRTVLKLASDLFPNEYIKLSKANMIRNNINMKCRKTVIRDLPN